MVNSPRPPMLRNNTHELPRHHSYELYDEQALLDTGSGAFVFINIIIVIHILNHDGRFRTNNPEYSTRPFCCGDFTSLLFCLVYPPLSKRFCLCSLFILWILATVLRTKQGRREWCVWKTMGKQDGMNDYLQSHT